MSAQDKAAERDTLILQLGQLIAPITVLAEKSPSPNSIEYRVTAAKFRQDFAHWRVEAGKFVVIGDVEFGHELNDITVFPSRFLNEISALANASSKDDNAKQVELRKSLERCKKMTLDAINKVPIAFEPELLAAATPFSTYLKIRDAMGTATRRIHYFDRYLDADFFPLYLRDKDRSLEIRLVTTHGNVDYGVINVAAVSKLAEQEFTDYQLIESQSNDLHDRNLRIDDNIFHLGPSLSDAGQRPTNFTPADNSAAAHTILDGLITNGTIVT